MAEQCTLCFHNMLLETLSTVSAGWHVVVNNVCGVLVTYMHCY
jgi:hypothetical protein